MRLPQAVQSWGFVGLQKMHHRSARVENVSRVPFFRRERGERPSKPRKASAS